MFNQGPGRGGTKSQRHQIRASSRSVHQGHRHSQHPVAGSKSGDGMGELLSPRRRSHPIWRVQDERAREGEGHLLSRQLLAS